MKSKIDNNNDVSFLEIIYTIIGWSAFIIVNSIQIFIAPVILILTFPFDRNKKVMSYMIKLFYYVFYFLNFVQKTDIDKNGLKASKKGERRIYVLNHASMFDVILMLLLPGPIKSIMKSSYAKIPVIGWIAVLAGNIVLEENPNKNNNVSVYMNVIKKLENGSPIMIFPEGTKSKNSKISKFYHGTFKIAQETKSDLVPVVFDTWNVIRPNGLWIRDVHPTIRILDTVKYEDFKEMDYKVLSNMIKIKLTEGLIKIREERRNKSIKYYRNKQEYIDLDNEMKDELKSLKEKHNTKKRETISV